MKAKDVIEGVKIGSLTAIRPWGESKDHNKIWLFHCDCGNDRPMRLSNVPKKGTPDCGHCGIKPPDWSDWRRQSPYTSLNRSWCNMKQRCNNNKDKRFYGYGGRGIKICNEWNVSYSAFKKWALDNGWKPNLTEKDQSLDRINVDGNYCPENCRWVDMKTQIRNRRNTNIIDFYGEKIPLAELAERYGIKYDTVLARYLKGKREYELILIPV